MTGERQEGGFSKGPGKPDKETGWPACGSRKSSELGGLRAWTERRYCGVLVFRDDEPGDGVSAGAEEGRGNKVKE